MRSRRLGLSLGINLLPLHSKFCSFNCIYCECGWTPPNPSNHPKFPMRAEMKHFLERRLLELAAEDYLPDALTYAGNGEPTLHPEFEGIVDDTIELRNRLAPEARVSVLSNASMLHDPGVFSALQKIDNNILKLDAGTLGMLDLINNPVEPVQFEELIGHLKRFEGRLIIQSMFLRGSFKGHVVDNTTDDEVERWIGHLREIRPQLVMIYPIARETPVHNLEKITLSELKRIAALVEATGLHAEVYS